jgi:hypothetical protein
MKTIDHLFVRRFRLWDRLARGAKALMSALGQKRTFRWAIGMSALPPKADIMSDMSNDSTRASHYPASMAAAPSR